MKRFENILCVVEPDDSSKAAIIQATTLAKNHQAKLTIVSVVKKAEVISGVSKSGGESEKNAKRSSAEQTKTTE